MEQPNVGYDLSFLPSPESAQQHWGKRNSNGTEIYHLLGEEDRDRSGTGAVNIPPENIFQGTLRRTSKALLLHSPAIAVTAILLWLNLAKVFWFAENPDPSGHVYPRGIAISMRASTLQNVLQLPSKLHEIFILISLGAIALNMSRRRMVDSGLPLGLLSAGYRLGDLEYFVGGSYRKGWKNAKWFASFLFLATLYSTIAGPTSAILMIPTTGWFDLPNAFSKVTMPLTWGIDAAATWPTRLDSSLYDQTDSCKGMDGIYLYYCSAGWFPEVYNWASGFSYIGLSDTLTYQQPTTRLSREVAIDENLDNVTCLTTVSGSSITSIGRFLQHIKDHDVGPASNQSRLLLSTDTKNGAPTNYQPIVQSKCAFYDREEVKEGKVKPAYDTSGVQCYGSPGCLKWKESDYLVSPDVWNDTLADKLISGYVIPSDDESVVMVVGHLPYIGSNEEQRSWVHACNLFAHWAPSTLMVDALMVDDTNQTAVLGSNITAPSGSEQWEDLGVQASDQIFFDNSWLEYMNPFFNVSNAADGDTGAKSARNPLEMVMAQYVRYHGDNEYAWLDLGRGLRGFDDLESARNEATHLFQRIFGVVLVEALSRLGRYEDPFLIVGSNDTSISFEQVGLEAGHGVYSGVMFVPEGADPATTNYTWTAGGAVEHRNETFAVLMADVKNWASWDFNVQRWGYGFGQPSEGTLLFGELSMGLYLLVVVVYALYNFWHFIVSRVLNKRPPRSSLRALGDLQDLLLLALRSPVSKSVRETRDSNLWDDQVRIGMDAAHRPRLVVHDGQGG